MEAFPATLTAKLRENSLSSGEFQGRYYLPKRAPYRNRVVVSWECWTAHLQYREAVDVSPQFSETVLPRSISSTVITQIFH